MFLLGGYGVVSARNTARIVVDDAYEHEAWNHSRHTRVVLFVDFVKPPRFPANLVNRCLLGLAVFTPFVREGVDNLREWEKRFYPRP
ncbi:aspartyl/asparaginyl beta-hydroxylase domain-containing protein [Streptoalloteichus hindustanus]|uniref:Aspartyl/Asparaginyl beta-hydroxylase n=1 Tax=Streptoalloteichus hindustanus TaxID=2017 RepID=A0A1M5D232_STRHI|nr:aspartyl/asparaginyl beta-hydroxylase domain-containing protein [Streptoalloteichus hindustanus]SHF61079.1 Aspartyl/Asparaginyl beta-hydroxylase [Streptoalloteichus hindustanus]